MTTRPQAVRFKHRFRDGMGVARHHVKGVYVWGVSTRRKKCEEHLCTLREESLSAPTPAKPDDYESPEEDDRQNDDRPEANTVLCGRKMGASSANEGGIELSDSRPQSELQPTSLEYAGTRVTLRPWLPHKCKIAAAVHNRLLQFPYSRRARVLALDSPLRSLGHMADVVGPHGRVVGVVSGSHPNQPTEAQIERFLKAHPAGNVSVIRLDWIKDLSNVTLDTYNTALGGLSSASKFSLLMGLHPRLGANSEVGKLNELSKTERSYVIGRIFNFVECQDLANVSCLVMSHWPEGATPEGIRDIMLLHIDLLLQASSAVSRVHSRSRHMKDRRGGEDDSDVGRQGSSNNEANQRAGKSPEASGVDRSEACRGKRSSDSEGEPRARERPPPPSEMPPPPPPTEAMDQPFFPLSEGSQETPAPLTKKERRAQQEQAAQDIRAQLARYRPTTGQTQERERSSLEAIVEDSPVGATNDVGEDERDTGEETQEMDGGSRRKGRDSEGTDSPNRSWVMLEIPLDRVGSLAPAEGSAYSSSTAATITSKELSWEEATKINEKLAEVVDCMKRLGTGHRTGLFAKEQLLLGPYHPEHAMLLLKYMHHRDQRHRNGDTRILQKVKRDRSQRDSRRERAGNVIGALRGSADEDSGLVNAALQPAEQAPPSQGDIPMPSFGGGSFGAKFGGGGGLTAGPGPGPRHVKPMAAVTSGSNAATDLAAAASAQLSASQQKKVSQKARKEASAHGHASGSMPGSALKAKDQEAAQRHALGMFGDHGEAFSEKPQDHLNRRQASAQSTAMVPFQKVPKQAVGPPGLTGAARTPGAPLALMDAPSSSAAPGAGRGGKGCKGFQAAPGLASQQPWQHDRHAPPSQLRNAMRPPYGTEAAPALVWDRLEGVSARERGLADERNAWQDGAAAGAGWSGQQGWGPPGAMLSPGQSMPQHLALPAPASAMPPGGSMPGGGKGAPANHQALQHMQSVFGQQGFDDLPHGLSLEEECALVERMRGSLPGPRPLPPPMSVAGPPGLTPGPWAGQLPAAPAAPLAMTGERWRGDDMTTSGTPYQQRQRKKKGDREYMAQFSC